MELQKKVKYDGISLKYTISLRAVFDSSKTCKLHLQVQDFGLSLAQSKWSSALNGNCATIKLLLFLSAVKVSRKRHYLDKLVVT